MKRTRKTYTWKNTMKPYDFVDVRPTERGRYASEKRLAGFIGFLLGVYISGVAYLYLSNMVLRDTLHRMESTNSCAERVCGEIELSGDTESAGKEPLSVGYVSYYSEDGCLGCSPTLTMANGQRFDENAMTLAYNHLPMNTRVLVINTENGLSQEAIVTDTGGFERHGRIADLSKGLFEVLQAKTDVSIIEIKEL